MSYHPQMPKGRALLEIACAVLFLAYLFWLPLPFGSTTQAAQAALVVPALAICALTCLWRIGTLSRIAVLQRPIRIWAAGALLFALVVAFQLVPLPNGLLGALSPESLRLWSAAGRVASLAGAGAPAPAHPISIDPQITTVHLFRVLAYIAVFFSAALLIRRHRARVAFSMTLGATAVFEALYGVREAVLHRYAIWGWTNRLIFNRVTGTFVNPNHFAHYAAIVLPLGVYIAALAWHDAASAGAPLRVRLVRVFERQLVRFGCGTVICVACLVAILVAQSRGALLATVAGFGLIAALAGSGRRNVVIRGALLGAVALASAIAVVAYLRLPMSRFEQVSEIEDAGGRTATIQAAWELWKRFPLFGSGLGTFTDVSSMTAIGSANELLNHAHDDYAEIAATTGTVGFLVALVPLLAGIVALARMIFGRPAASVSRRSFPLASYSRRSFQVAALASIAIALVHALIEFNFFIPANPATLAAIAGAAVSIREAR